ncbi:Fibronectin type III domain protein [Trichostrongylus colubriformis]|uniref:Fibronectin type III domain protein n=1 Tax=Trichostrongylus colubriformis TaxID=6319 RepID=A0AAN8FQ84_TRICO
MHHGRVLRLDHAEVSDAGRYKCSAGNALGVAAREVTMTLRTPPTIIIPLSNRLVASESEFTLECPLSTMDAHSSVEWFKDAKPIVPLLMPSDQRRRFHVDQTRLTVNSTTGSDSGVYQCVVSNEVGTASSSAYVQIRDSPPIFPRQSMPRKVFTVNGSSVSIPCFYHASPRGHSRWADAGGAKLPHKGRVRDHHGVLVIENVLHDDAGYFFCTAHNRLGKAHSQVELVVVERAQVRMDSADLGATSDDAMNISCSVEIDCGQGSECPEAFFKWTFDNRSLNSLPGMHFKTKFREHTRQSKQGRHIVQEVGLQVSAPGKAYRPQKIACHSLYGEDSVDMQPRTQVAAPLALKVEQDQKAVRLAWRKTNTHRDIRNHAVSGEIDPSSGYLVELRTKEDRQWRPAPREVVAESEPQAVTLNGLVPNTLYQFRVRSVDTSTTLGDPSVPTTWVKTPPAPPSEAVESLKWKALDNVTILVEWDPVETAHQSGDHLRYRLSWSLDDDVDRDTSSQDRKFHAHHIDTKTPQAVVRLNASEECRMLLFSVRPINDQGVGAVSTDTVAFVNSKGEPRRVSFTNVTVLNSTHASFSWEWEKTNECGKARAVQLTCTPSEEDPLTVVISGEFSEWTLGGLSAETKYECVLRPLNGEDDYGEYSSPVEIVTKHQPPSEAPSISKLSLRTTESDVGYTTIIEWSAISFPHGNISDPATTIQDIHPQIFTPTIIAPWV